MVVFSLPSIRSNILLEACNVFRGRGFCSKAGQAKPNATYHYDVLEVKHHETMAKEWWDPNGSMKALHAMNDVRIPFIKNGLVNSHRLKALEVKNKAKYLEGVTILDVGCGGGILCEPLARLGGTVVGIDPSENLVNVARAHVHGMTAPVMPTYHVSTIEEHAHANMASYDMVVTSEVIEHVTDKESFLAASIASLKMGGSLFITTPNRTLVSWLGGILMAEHVLSIVPRGTHSYSKFIKPAEISVLLEKYGCSVQLINGMFYDPVRNRWIWSPTKAFIYALHAIKIKDLFR